MKTNIVKTNIIKGLIMLLVFSFSSCSNESKFDLGDVDVQLSPNFSANIQRVFVGKSIQYKNQSSGALSYVWTFEGGEPSTSTDQNPLVVYNTPGKYKVTLQAINGAKKVEIIRDNFLEVYSDERWKNFVSPTIEFTNTTLDGNGALYASLVPNPESFIQGVCLDVCRSLYKGVDEIDVLNKITYTINDSDVLSAKGGQPPHISIHFSSKYLMQKKKEGMSDANLVREIEGVLVHELTHGYQFSPQGAGGYQQGADFYGFIEGMADYVRYLQGYFTTSRRKAGGHWNDGYCTTGFFMDWLHSKDVDFIYKLNQSAKTINPWSWDAATKKILGVSVNVLWNEYQKDLTSGNITKIDERLKKIRNGDESL